MPISGGQWLAPVPGMPGETCDRRILPDVVTLIRRYHVAVTDCYAPTGHAADGEHPLGLAVDLVPGRGGSWDDVDWLAAWAEPAQNQPRGAVPVGRLRRRRPVTAAATTSI